MTCLEKLLSAVERENKGDGTTPERWRTVLLTSIADSLAVIADKLTEEKKGHWIPVEYSTGVDAFGVKEMTAVALKCSECGEEVDISDGDFKLCPYCGIKMQ